jgi:GNAT superfamily N-acetyltransferase
VDDATIAVALDLLGRFFAEEGFTTPPDAQRRGLAEMLADPLRCAAVLAFRVEGGARRPVGLATAAWMASVEHTRAAELEDLYVVPAERGRGVAGALIEAVVRWSRQRGCATLLVTVTPDGELSHGLTGFYTRRGFADEYRKLLALDLRAAP